jgi:hypothetical protein
VKISNIIQIGLVEAWFFTVTRFKLVHFSFNTFASRLMPSIVCELNERAIFSHKFNQR